MLMNVLGFWNCILRSGMWFSTRPKVCSLGLGFVSSLVWFVSNALILLQYNCCCDIFFIVMFLDGES
jgi:hypothetical protein